MESSANVFLTKSFWLPVITYVVSWGATTIQPWLELAADDQMMITGGIMVVVIALVRRVTTRPAHWRKGD